MQLSLASQVYTCKCISWAKRNITLAMLLKDRGSILFRSAQFLQIIHAKDYQLEFLHVAKHVVLRRDWGSYSHTAGWLRNVQLITSQIPNKEGKVELYEPTNKQQQLTASFHRWSETQLRKYQTWLFVVIWSGHGTLIGQNNNWIFVIVATTSAAWIEHLIDSRPAGPLSHTLFLSLSVSVSFTQTNEQGNTP